MQVIPLPFIREDANIRITPDKPPRISVIDVIMSVCETNKAYAAKIYSRVSKEEWTNRPNFCPDFKFPGQGQRDTPVCDLDTIIIIMQHLPGKVAAKNREKTAETMRRYFAGDPTLHAEIERNATSNDPVCQIARASMPEAVPPPVEEISTGKRTSEITNDELYQLDLIERKQKIQQVDIQIQREMTSMKMENLRLVVIGYRDIMKEVCGELDDTASALLKDYIQNNLVIMCDNNSSSTSLVYNNEDQPIDISARAVELGKKLDSRQAQDVGKKMKELYIEKYGEMPGKTRRMIGGRWLDVNAYKRKDIDLLDKAIECVLRGGEGQKNITHFLRSSQ
eukprot:240107-Hanusia_phi.AAC.3